MSLDLYIGTVNGIHRLSESNGDWQVTGTPFASDFHPLAMEYCDHDKRMFVSFLRGGVVIGDVHDDKWTLHNDGLEDREVWCLCHNSQTGVTYAGTQPAEIWCLNQGEKDWKRLADLTQMEESKDWIFPVPPNIPHARALAFDPLKPDVMYCGIEVGALLKSKDGGRTWKDLKNVGHDVHRIIVSEYEEGVVFVATGDDKPPYKRGGGYGIYYSSDGGDTWEQRVNGMDERTYTEDAISLDEAGSGESIIYAVGVEDIPPLWAGRGDGKTYFLQPNKEVRERGANAVVYKSTDAGKNWLPMMDGLPSQLFDMAWAFDQIKIDGIAHLFMATTAGDIFHCDTEKSRWEQLKVKDSLGFVTHIRAAEI